MARAHSVWVVMGMAAPIAGFTVKHELVDWLRERMQQWPLRPPVFIYRLADGGGDGPVCTTKVWTDREFLDK